ncbi:MAG: ABC transporter ATP-binding protein [Rhodobacteraceae bacterium]|nr:ABC transporter ATP-binding protein [Paracoccaceae bacterium]
MIFANDLSVRRNGRLALQGASFTLRRGECVGLIGPNGAGKTTLLRAAFGLDRCEGQSSLAALAAWERARVAAYLPQGRVIAWPVPVRDLVALGRLPYLEQGARLPVEVAALVDHVLDQLDLTGFGERDATALSGGETARVLLARALVQQTPFILADEPAAGLDPGHQISVMRLFHELAGQQGRGVLVTCHDLALAARFCDRLIVLKDGVLVAEGPPEQVLTAALLADVFGLRARIEATQDGLHLSQMDVLAD